MAGGGWIIAEADGIVVRKKGTGRTQMKTRRVLKLCVWAALSVLAPAGLANALASEASRQNLEAGQALLAIETHRAAIIDRLLIDYAQVLAQRGLDADALRATLNGLRADQLLAATLV